MTTLYPFTSGRDYRPQSAASLPPNVVYARVIVMAPDFDDACRVLAEFHLTRYEETLRGPATPDAPAEAVDAYVRDNGITEPAVFLLYRVDTDPTGKALTAPRLMVALVHADGPHVIGRVRGTGPDVQNPVFRVVPELDQDDEVALVGTADEGPAADVLPVEGPAVFPDGAIGYLAKMRERQLLSGLAEVRTELEQVIARIERARRSTDPRVSWGRDSSKLLELSRTLAALGGDAGIVEVVLQSVI